MQMNESLRAKNLGNHPNIQARKVLGIVLHDTAGSGTHGDTNYLTLDPEHRGVSVDFTAERDGTIYKLNPDLRKYWTFHAGRATEFKGLKNGQVNSSTIGIEIVQKANLSLIPKWPPEQVKAVAHLCAYLCGLFQLQKEDITTHKKIIRDGSRSDPRDWPWEEFWSQFNEYVRETGLTDVATEYTHKVEAGDTLFSLAVRYSTTVESIKALNNMGISNQINLGDELLVKV